MKRFLLLLFIWPALAGFGQNSSEDTRHILILLDGSGSMMDTWKGTTKWTTAKRLIGETLDSIQRENPDVEIGLRVFGHQSPRAMKDCRDSKLEVAIGRNTAQAIITKLGEITPQGNTPIAYSLFLASGDFTAEGINSIILITDGIENCEGDPCASAESLSSKRISLKPFIIGIGLNEADKHMFDCVGSYYDAADSIQFKNAMNIVVSQALNNTTAQINLLDAYGRANQTNVELTLYDSYSKEVRYHFVHSLNAKGEPDTLFLDPLGRYDIVAHTTPAVTRKNVELNPGRHNIIGLEAPQGVLKLYEKGQSGFSGKQCVVRDPETHEIVYVQNLNTEQLYLSGKYDLEVLTLPPIFYHNYFIQGNYVNQIDIPQSGVLSLNTNDNVQVSVLYDDQGNWVKVWEGSLNREISNVDLQPGEYLLVYRSNIRKTADNTKQTAVSIRSGRTFSVKL
ncbi:MAG: VWA domain-containing protein [Chitinophagales bacterium]|nr:VWA domain-containing protein [Chitinophagales bacterium]HAE13115.1 von willebrand factor type a [Bacteroidota bacterium]HAE35736.1 von willebrand factor type a [Bacteroidota bacterium]HPE96949.1 VWA domain-containing protein [Chitinophagales bacterium]HQU38678.1 VWA domain-containing protein [Chitinophagales bacterium]